MKIYEVRLSQSVRDTHQGIYTYSQRIETYKVKISDEILDALSNASIMFMSCNDVQTNKEIMLNVNNILSIKEI